MYVCNFCPRGNPHNNKKLSYRPGTARRATSVEILPTAAQLCEKIAFERLAIAEWSWWSPKVIDNRAIRYAVYHFQLMICVSTLHLSEILPLLRCTWLPVTLKSPLFW